MNEDLSNFHYCKNYFQFTRLRTREVFIGDIPLGGTHPIRIQSMTNTDTLDTKATVEQSIRMIEAGCEFLRIATPSIKAAENLATIKKQLRAAGFNTPIIADVHFSTQVALTAARFAEKVRINPGNYTDRNVGKIHFSSDEWKQAVDSIRENIIPLLKVCKQYGTAIRIGSNQGSLSERIVSRHGDTPTGMVEAAMEFVRICAGLDFHNLVLSMKSSNTRNMVYATRLLVHKMMEEGFDYPLHLGVTEAGSGEDGRIKSAVGIGTLLTDGIGDTIRVSLTEAPEKEMAPAKKLVERFVQMPQDFSQKNIDPFKNPFAYERIPTVTVEKIGSPMPPVVICSKVQKDEEANHFFKADYAINDENLLKRVHFIHGDSKKFIHWEREALYRLLQQQDNNPNIFHRIYDGPDKKTIQLQAATDFGALLIDGLCDGIFIETPDIPDQNFPIDLSFSILQAARARFSKAEIISCPSCGRTQYDIVTVVDKIREKTIHLKGITIAVMGCIVNGPGEMAGADYGYIGSGNGTVTLFKGKNIVMKNISAEQSVEALIQLIKDSGDWTPIHT